MRSNGQGGSGGCRRCRPPGAACGTGAPEALKAKLGAACARLEAEAKAEAEATRPAFEAKIGNRGRAPVPPDPNPPAERQSNLTDPDSTLMHRSDHHEYRQAYNAQAVVCADGSQLVVATNLVATTADAPSFTATILAMEKTIGLPKGHHDEGQTGDRRWP